MKTLTFRLTLWFALIVTITVALILWAGRFFLEGNLLRGMDFLNDAEFEEIVHRLEQPVGEEDGRSIAEAIGIHTDIDAALFFFQVCDARGETLFTSSNLGDHTLPNDPGAIGAFSTNDPEFGHLRVGEYKVGAFTVLIASSLQSVDALFKDYSMMVAWVLAAVFFVSLALGVFLSRLALNPVSNIQRIARRISAHNLSERIPVPPGGDELSQLSEFLNEMFDRLEAAFLQISRFTADASHELRTPLSLVRLHSERLLQNPDLSVEERMAALTEQMREIERLNKLIDDLLFIAKADAGVLQLNLKPVNLGLYLEDFSEDARLLCEERGVYFKLEQDPSGGQLNLDPVWFRHVFLNLLSNSLRVSAAGSTIRLVSTPLSEKAWCFTFEDEGPGLPESAVERIFARFERFTLDDTEENSGNSGLGLAICQSIVTQHHGRIHARNRASTSGLAVVIELPRMR